VYNPHKKIVFMGIFKGLIAGVVIGMRYGTRRQATGSD